MVLCRFHNILFIEVYFTARHCSLEIQTSCTNVTHTDQLYKCTQTNYKKISHRQAVQMSHTQTSCTNVHTDQLYKFLTDKLYKCLTQTSCTNVSHRPAVQISHRPAVKMLHTDQLYKCHTHRPAVQMTHHNILFIEVYFLLGTAHWKFSPIIIRCKIE